MRLHNHYSPPSITSFSLNFYFVFDSISSPKQLFLKTIAELRGVPHLLLQSDLLTSTARPNLIYERQGSVNRAASKAVGVTYYTPTGPSDQPLHCSPLACRDSNQRCNETIAAQNIESVKIYIFYICKLLSAARFRVLRSTRGKMNQCAACFVVAF